MILVQCILFFVLIRLNRDYHLVYLPPKMLIFDPLILEMLNLDHLTSVPLDPA